MARFFKKISYEEFKKYFGDNIILYNEYSIPKRKTNSSAGYDFEVLDDYKVKPNEILNIPTGVKVSMNDDEVLFIVVRSSTGFKYNIRLVNQLGVIDSDYYNNKDNDGHIFVKIQNHSDKDFIIKKGDRIVQGIFTKYLTVDNEEKIKEERVGGIGSTKR